MNVIIGGLLGGVGGRLAGKRIGKHLAKRKMTKSLVNRIKYNPITRKGKTRRANLLKKYQRIGANTGDGVGTLTGGGIGLAKDIRDIKRFAREYGKNQGRYTRNTAARTDVNDLLKQFGKKRKSDFKTKKDVKTEFRAAARRHHPDLRGGDGEKMRKVNESWDMIQETNWFKKLSMAAMRDEMSKIASEIHAHRAKLAFASGGINTKVLDTKPLDVNQQAKPMKVSKNAGAPKGVRGPNVPTVAGMKGKRTDPINPSLVTNA